MKSRVFRMVSKKMSSLLAEEELRHFVPPHDTISMHALLTVEHFIQNSKRLFVLTGAGISTESGIKDYRSEGVGLYATTSSRPTNYSDFLRSAAARQRYWARNTTAWPVFSSFRPNISHKALATLEHRGSLHWLVTQNVDSLHHKAGSRRVTELHGTVASVVCLDCRRMLSRDEVQDKILRENPSWSAKPEGFAPDADVFVSQSYIDKFRTPSCDSCGGILKPDVVFFGDTVPRRRVEDINQRLAESDACLVIGSSVETYSSFRHVRWCKDQGKPLLIINIGPTRADPLTDAKVVARSGEIFEKMMERNTL